MRYNVTLATKAFELITYDVDCACEDDAKAQAASRLLAKRPWLDPLDVAVAKIVDVGVTPGRPRRRRRKRVKPVAEPAAPIVAATPVDHSLQKPGVGPGT